MSATKTPEKVVYVPQKGNADVAIDLAREYNKQLAADDVLWTAIAEKSTLLEAWEKCPPRRLSRRVRFNRWRGDHIWQPLHDWAVRHGAWCDDY